MLNSPSHENSIHVVLEKAVQRYFFFDKYANIINKNR